MAELEKLHCVIGDHDWSRERKRGKKPKNCPDHKPVVAPPLDPAERTRRQQEGRRIKQEARDKEGIVEVLAYRAWVKKDAAIWALYRSGELTEQEYKDRKPRMPKIPDRPAYKAAARAGVIAPDIDDDDSEE